jgi:hypothetical protein
MNRNVPVPFLGEERTATFISLPDPRTKAKAKRFTHRFRTGDIVRAVVPAPLKKAGTHVGRMSAKANGAFTIATAKGTVTDIGKNYCRILQHADGYGYTQKGEAAFPPTA